MAGPGDEIAAGAGGRGHLRASDADREQVIGTLKAAFVQGRLARDEFDLRVGQTLAARTYADLAALTADLPALTADPPARPAVPEPAAKPAGTPARTLAKAARRSGICMLIAFALVGFVALTNAEVLLPPAFLTGVAAIIAASGFLGYGVVDAWQERRSRRQLPPRPRWDGKGLEGGRLGSTGCDPAPPRAHTDRARFEVRTGPGRDRRHPSGRDSRTPRGIRPVPEAG